MPEAIIELIVRCVFALAIIVYAIINKRSLNNERSNSNIEK